MYFRLTLGVLEMYVYGIIVEIDGLLLKSYFGLILSAVKQVWAQLLQCVLRKFR